MLSNRGIRSGRNFSAQRWPLSRSSSSSSLSSYFTVMHEVITEIEEKELCAYISSLLKRKRYEGEHWDSVISKYKELELHKDRKLPARVNATLKRLESTIKGSYNTKVSLIDPHVIDLDAEGRIGSHVDSVKHSGGVLCGLSLLSTRVMKLRIDQDSSNKHRYDDDEAVSMLLPPRSLYFLAGPCRYDFTHSILGKNEWDPMGACLEMAADADTYNAAVQRRLSIIWRDPVVTGLDEAPSLNVGERESGE
jgi:hypothetical protein